MVLLIAGAGTMAQSVYAETPTFGNTLNLSNDSGASYDPQIAVSGSYVYVAWQDNTPGNVQLFLRISSNNGLTFGPTIDLSNTPRTGTVRGFNIVASGSNVYVVWNDNRTGNFDTFFARSTDNGATFSPAINLSNDPGNTLCCVFPIAVSGSNVYIAWSDNTYGNYQVFFTRSTDNGQSFAGAVNLCCSAGNSYALMFASGSNVYLTYENDASGNFEIFFILSTDNGQSFSKAINLSNTPGNSYGGIRALSGNNIYVLWGDFSSTFALDFKAGSISNNGVTWGSTITLDQSTIASNYWSLAASGSYIHVVWESNGILYRTSADYGATFSKTVRLGSGYAPTIVSSGSNVYVVWGNYNSKTNGDIYFRASSDNGTTWGSTINLSNNSGHSYAPAAIALSANHVYVAWSDDTPGNLEILFRAS